MSEDKRLSILIISCDKNTDVLSHQVELFGKYWGDCSFPVYLVSESKAIESNYKTILFGQQTTWTKEVLYAIDQTPGRYVLLLLDDAYLYESVNNQLFVEIVDFMEKNSIKYYRIPRMRNRYLLKADFPDSDNVSRLFDNRAYEVTIGITIWDKFELKNVFGDGSRTAWEIENDFSKNAVHNKGAFIDGYVTDKRMILSVAHMITAGKWMPSGLRIMKKHGVIIDTKPRGVLSLGKRIQMTVYYVGTKICPTPFRHVIKKALSFFGFKFVTKY